MSLLVGILSWVGALGAACGIGYYLLCLRGARSFCRDAAVPLPEFTPPVSILKPLRGTDPDIYEAFRSHCIQDYPEYEMIFGVSDAADPAVPLVERLQREFPERQIKLVVCAQSLGANRKVSNLIQMLAVARHQFLLVNDSDIRVPENYLRRVIAPMESPDVGLVTCLYRGHPGKSVGSKLEAIGIATEFHPGVLAARALEGDIRFALGSTLAFSRVALKTIGGLETLVDYLADDYELGHRISEKGFRVVLSDIIVDTHVPEYSFGAFFEHQLRWARSTRHSRKWGYAGLVLTFAVPWAALAVLATRGALWSWLLLAGATALRCAVALRVGVRLLRDPHLLRDLWLLPLRDIVALLVWIGSYAGHNVAWRGDQFVLRDGKLLPAQENAK
jgi:ceramide glucosyltransferase